MPHRQAPEAASRRAPASDCSWPLLRAPSRPRRRARPDPLAARVRRGAGRGPRDRPPDLAPVHRPLVRLLPTDGARVVRPGPPSSPWPAAGSSRSGPPRRGRGARPRFGITLRPGDDPAHPRRRVLARHDGYADPATFLALLGRGPRPRRPTTAWPWPGYCPVRLVQEGRLEAGRPALALQHEGRQYWFADAATRDAFLKDPAAYLPADGGRCPVRSVEGKQAVAGDPRPGRPVSGPALPLRRRRGPHQVRRRPGALRQPRRRRPGLLPPLPRQGRRARPRPAPLRGDPRRPPLLLPRPRPPGSLPRRPGDVFRWPSRQSSGAMSPESDVSEERAGDRTGPCEEPPCKTARRVPIVVLPRGRLSLRLWMAGPPEVRGERRRPPPPSHARRRLGPRRPSVPTVALRPARLDPTTRGFARSPTRRRTLRTKAARGRPAPRPGGSTAGMTSDSGGPEPEPTRR